MRCFGSAAARAVSLAVTTGCVEKPYNPGDPASDDHLRLTLWTCFLTRCWDPTWSILSYEAGSGNEPTHLLLEDGFLFFSGGGGSTDQEWRMEKRSRSTGALAAEFGASGTLTVNPSPGSDVGRGLLVHQGRISWVGEDNNGGDRRLRMMRLDATTGAPDTSFGTGGTGLNNPTAGNDHYRTIASDGTSMYVIGNDSVAGNWQFRIEKRSVESGALETGSGFGVSGILQYNPSANPDEITSGAVAGGALWLLGYQRGAGNNDWVVEKRTLGTGAYDLSFLGTGSYYPALSASDESPQGLCFSDSHLFVVGSDQSGGFERWRVEKRALSDGALDSSFGNAGVILEDIDADGQGDAARACATAGGLLVIAGGSGFGGQLRYRIEARSPATGAPVWEVRGSAALGTSTAASLAADEMHVFAGIRTDQGWLLEKRFLATGSF